MVLNLDKCIGCHTCSVTCKNVWTSRPGVEYAWFNNVETKPGIGYPREWENQAKWNGGWMRRTDGSIAPRQGGKWSLLMRIDRKSTRLNSSHQIISYAVFCLKKKKYIYQPDPSMRLVIDASDFGVKNPPKFHRLSIRAYPLLEDHPPPSHAFRLTPPHTRLHIHRSFHGQLHLVRRRSRPPRHLSATTLTRSESLMW